MRSSRVTRSCVLAGAAFAILLSSERAAAAPATAPAATPSQPPSEPGPFRTPDLVELTTLDPTIRLDIRYARKDNFTGAAVYSEARAFLQRPAAEALVRAHRALRQGGYGLLVFDGYRPWSVTRRFWEITPADKKVFVADPAKGSKHNRGCAVDLTLYDLATGLEVAMPSPYDDMTSKAYATYDGGDARARERREILRDAMEREGFFVYTHEWWHFDYKDWRDYPILDVPFSSIAPAAIPAAAATTGGPVAAPSIPSPDAVPWDLTTVRMVDLTWTFDATTLYWPTSPSAFELKPLSRGKTEAGYFYAANTFCAPEHGGTHLDAPIHFAEKGWSAEQIPLERLIAPGVVIDVTRQAAADADYRLTREDVERWEEQNGRIAAGSIALLRTGWGKRWPDRARYFGSTDKDAAHLHFPGYGEAAARLLVEGRRVAALGIDTPSIDYGPSKDFVVHVTAMTANVIGLENVARLEDLPSTGALVVALPVKIGGGSGGPLRLAALVPSTAAAPSAGAQKAEGGAR